MVIEKNCISSEAKDLIPPPPQTVRDTFASHSFQKFRTRYPDPCPQYLVLRLLRIMVSVNLPTSLRLDDSNQVTAKGYYPSVGLFFLQYSFESRYTIHYPNNFLAYFCPFNPLGLSVSISLSVIRSSLSCILLSLCGISIDTL